MNEDQRRHEPKSISKESIGEAMKKVERYRLLNEPVEAESICRDVLRIDPDNQQALIDYLLSVTDQFVDGIAGQVSRAWDLIPRLDGEYEKAYYSGIICERRAKAQHRQYTPQSRYITYHWLREAMGWYEKAEALRLKGNDNPVIRWNACARMINDNPQLEAAPDDGLEPPQLLE